MYIIISGFTMLLLTASTSSNNAIVCTASNDYAFVLPNDRFGDYSMASDERKAFSYLDHNERIHNFKKNEEAVPARSLSQKDKFHAKENAKEGIMRAYKMNLKKKAMDNLIKCSVYHDQSKNYSKSLSDCFSRKEAIEKLQKEILADVGAFDKKFIPLYHCIVHMNVSDSLETNSNRFYKCIESTDSTSLIKQLVLKKYPGMNMNSIALMLCMEESSRKDGAKQILDCAYRYKIYSENFKFTPPNSGHPEKINLIGNNTWLDILHKKI